MPARYRTMSEREQQRCALQASERRLKERGKRLFGVAGIAGDALHREALERARDADHLAIDGPPPVAGLMRSALLSAPLLIAARPSPVDGWASDEILRLVSEARIFRPHAVNRHPPNRSAVCAVIARRNANAHADHGPPPRTPRIGQRVTFADAARSGRLVSTLAENTAARGSHGKSTARLTIDGALALRGRVTVAAFRRGLPVAEMLQTSRAGDFPDDSGAAP
jgi:chromosome partitioning protein